MISLDKCSGSCNVLSVKVPKKTKYINVNVFNMITNNNEAKTMAKYISCDCKYKFNSATCAILQIKNRIMKHVIVTVEISYLQKRLLLES